MYTYLSFLGQDWFFPLIMLFIQSLIPVVLFVSHYEAFTDSYEDKWCTHRDNPNGTVMLVGVFVYYLVKVIPEQVSSFYVRVSDSSDAMSILNGLRQSVYIQDEVSSTFSSSRDPLRNQTLWTPP